MSALLECRDQRHRNRENLAPLTKQLKLATSTESGVRQLRELILMLAVQGKLATHDSDDEPASVLLEGIRVERLRLQSQGLINRGKPLPAIDKTEVPFALPAGWEWVRLGSLLQKIGAGSTPLGGKDVYVTRGVKFLRSQNVWDDGLRLEGVAFITPGTHAKMAGTVVRANDLLFNITGASIGRCAVVPADFDEANVSQHVTIIRPAISSVTAFLHKVLISRHVQQTVRDVQVGVSREGLSIAKLSNFLIPIPPLAEQARIVARLDELMCLCDALEANGRLEAEQHARLLDALLGSLTSSTSPEELATNWQRVVAHFDLLLDRTEAVDALERTVVELAVRGLVVAHSQDEEPAEQLLSRIQCKRRAGRKIVKADQDAILTAEYTLPRGWAWASVDEMSADFDNAIADGPFGANLKTVTCPLPPYQSKVGSPRLKG